MPTVSRSAQYSTKLRAVLSGRDQPVGEQGIERAHAILSGALLHRGARFTAGEVDLRSLGRNSPNAILSFGNYDSFLTAPFAKNERFLVGF